MPRLRFTYNGYSKVAATLGRTSTSPAQAISWLTRYAAASLCRRIMMPCSYIVTLTEPAQTPDITKSRRRFSKQDVTVTG